MATRLGNAMVDARRNRLILAAIVLGILVLALVLLAPGGRASSRDGSLFDPRIGALRASDPAFEPTLALYTRAVIEPGTSATVLLNGDETFPALWRDLRAARMSIEIEQYFARQGAVADTLAAILIEQARAGVHVRVLLDGLGAKTIDGTWLARLRAGGVEAVILRPLHWQTLYRAGNRSHVRIVSIDDVIAYSGGLGFADDWLGDGRSPGHWRETNVRVTGPVTAQFRAAFAGAWFEATGELLTDIAAAARRPVPAVPGNARAGLFLSIAADHKTAAPAFVALAIGSAEYRLYISSSYFIPDSAMRAWLIDAAQRGVDVRIITAGTSTDVPAARLAGHNAYGDLLRGGVRLYEYAPAMMHAKTIVVDGRWTSIGSMNLDRRSLSLNDEANLLVFSPTVAAQMDSVFCDDLRYSRELTLLQYEQRGWASRLLDWLAMLGSRML